MPLSLSLSLSVDCGRSRFCSSRLLEWHLFRPWLLLTHGWLRARQLFVQLAIPFRGLLFSRLYIIISLCDVMKQGKSAKPGFTLVLPYKFSFLGNLSDLSAYLFRNGELSGTLSLEFKQENANTPFCLLFLSLPSREGDKAPVMRV